MSYNLISATGRKKATSVWEPVDLASIKLNVLYNDYSDVKATLTNPVLDGKYLCDLYELPTSLRVLTITFVEWLVLIGNQTLPVTPIPEVELSQPVTFHDIWMWNFSVALANHRLPFSDSIRRDELTDALITKDGVDYDDLANHCVVTVNGMLHMLSATPDGVYAIGAGTSLHTSNNNQMGLLNFRGLGKINTVPLTRDNIIHPMEDLPLSDSTFVDAGVPLTGKTVLLSYAGYLFPLSDEYDIVAPTIVKINTRLMNMIARYYESRDFIDWSDVYVVEDPLNHPDSVVKEDFFTDEVFQAIIDMPQTFLIVIDATDVIVERESLSQSNLPGVYSQYGTALVEPVTTYLGRLPEYIQTAEVGEWMVKIDDAYVPDLHRERVIMNELTVYENSSLSRHPRTYSDVKLLRIRKQLTA